MTKEIKHKLSGDGYILYRDAFPKEYTTASLNPPSRNDVIEEVAAELERFTFAFGVDTVASFTVFIRGLKD